MSQFAEVEERSCAIVLTSDGQGFARSHHGDSLGRKAQRAQRSNLEVIMEQVGSITENDVLLSTASDAILMVAV